MCVLFGGLVCFFFVLEVVSPFCFMGAILVMPDIILHLSLLFLPPLALSKAVSLVTGYSLESPGEIFFFKYQCPGLTVNQLSQDFWSWNSDNSLSSQGDSGI